MVVFPPYIKLVQSNSVRRTDEAVRVSAKRNNSSHPSDEKAASESKPLTDMVELISNENRRAVEHDIPTALEAEEALRKLETDIPKMGQGVGDLHSGMDRRIILALLAPLVES